MRVTKAELEVELDKAVNDVVLLRSEHERITQLNGSYYREIQELKDRIAVCEADENGLRETISHLNTAIISLNGVTP